jgi:anhydro-N-acetylmuramic acid kinase
MSGTSLDGVDAVLLDISHNRHQIVATHSVPFSHEFRQSLLQLHDVGANEIERAALAGNQLASLYAKAVTELLEKCQCTEKEIHAIGAHGQTIRHRPEVGYTTQIINPALLAELTKISVVADFRSRDIAAGGQGAPLVPAFHQAVFSNPVCNRVVINLGGIANLTYLPTNGSVIGFDSGPGNMLMDAWIQEHRGLDYDANGLWAESGQVIQALLEILLRDAYFAAPPPKSTGRDLFNLGWLLPHVSADMAPEDVQCTLLELTACSIAQSLKAYCPDTHEIYLCGGGAHNGALFKRLQHLLEPAKIDVSDALGIGVNWVEAAAFAWLAQQTMQQKPGNLSTVTGAQGPRILGAIYAR